MVEKPEAAKEKPKGTSTQFWNNVLNTLKEERNPVLVATLQGTKAQKLDDLTVGIEFPNGLDSFKKAIIEKSENMQQLKRLISIECKKDMRIKLIDTKKQAESQKQDTPIPDIGLNINIIE